MCSKWSIDDAKIVREMIFKENEFINHRSTWLVILQGLLFGALSFAHEKAHELIILLGITGIIVSGTSFIGLYLTTKAIKKLLSEWEKNKPENYIGPDVIGYHSPNKMVKFFLPWSVLPVLFFIIWASVLVMHY